MKKAFSIIALCMAIILCIPTVPAFAANLEFCIYLNSTKENYTGNLYNVVDGAYSWTATNVSISNTSDFLTSEFEDYFIFSGAPYDGQSCQVASLNGGSNYRLVLVSLQYRLTHICILSDTEFTASFYNCNLSNYTKTLIKDSQVSVLCEYNGVSFYGLCIGEGNFLNDSVLDKNVTLSGDGTISGLGDSFNIFYSSVVIYSIMEDPLQLNFSNGGRWYFQCQSIFYDFQEPLNETVDALTVNGVVNGFDTGINTPGFSFSDTSYNGGIAFNYQQTHLYTQYNNAQGANETCVFKWALDERSRSITQTASDWLMHYYVIVYWHWTQATDSSVYTPLLSGGSGGSMAFEFDAEPNFIMQGQTEISIWDLVQHVPTISSVSDEDIVSLAVAVQCLNGDQAVSVWHDIFGQKGQYVADVASDIISSGKLEVQGVGDVGGDFINGLFNPYYYYALDDLRIKLVAHPWSGTKNIHGGNGDFDLNLRSNESYGTTQGYVDDGGTPDDPSDDTQYPTNTVPQQNNVVVPVTYPTSGGNVTVYSIVQVPDSGGGGGNSINYSPTFSPSIVMDSDLDDLKETVDAYPQVPNQHFWDYFLVFKDNAFLDATSDFFGALPSELSSLLISSIGIIGVFAIYRFVRRR